MLLTKLQLQAHQFTSDDIERKRMHNLYVEPDGRITATDGHTLVQVTPPVDLPPTEGFPALGEKTYPVVDKPTLISAKTAKDVTRALPKKAAIPIVENAVIADVNETGTTLLTTDFTDRKIFYSHNNGTTFPEYDKVIKGQTGSSFAEASERAQNGKGKFRRTCVDALKLANLLKYMAASDKPEPMVELLVPESGRAAILLRRTTVDGHHIDALLMPMRG